MKKDEFTDRIFDILNESDEWNLSDIREIELGKVIRVDLEDGTAFTLTVNPIEE